MTEIGEAAKRKACELANEFCDGSWSVDEFNNPHNPSFMGAAALRALARILQEHSDVAKDAAAMARNGEWSNAADTLQSLILPDEPCDHLLNVCNLRALVAANPHLRCYKCGKALKIVEADNE